LALMSKVDGHAASRPQERSEELHRGHLQHASRSVLMSFFHSHSAFC
jgi:hypothetical protein